jgi:hypothetical protein
MNWLQRGAAARPADVEQTARRPEPLQAPPKRVVRLDVVENASNFPMTASVSSVRRPETSQYRGVFGLARAARNQHRAGDHTYRSSLGMPRCLRTASKSSAVAAEV